jgi:hypothetical protein
MQSTATTVQDYLTSLPDDRREALSAVRDVILKNLPDGYEEVIGWGMICYVIPLSRYPNTYNGEPLAIASLASQKNYMSLYLMCVYGDSSLLEWFRGEYAASGKKLDMGKSCVHFKKLEDLPLDVIGKTIARVSVDKFISVYEKAKGAGKQK